MNFDLTYGPETDAAYLYLAPVETPSAEQLYGFTDKEVPGEIIIDLVEDGTVLGIEILRAKEILAPELLKGAQLLP